MRTGTILATMVVWLLLATFAGTTARASDAGDDNPGQQELVTLPVNTWQAGWINMQNPNDLPMVWLDPIEVQVADLEDSLDPLARSVLSLVRAINTETRVILYEVQSLRWIFWRTPPVQNFGIGC